MQDFWPQEVGRGCLRGASHGHGGRTRPGQHGMPSSGTKGWTYSLARSEAEKLPNFWLIKRPLLAGSRTANPTPSPRVWEHAAEMGWPGTGRERGGNIKKEALGWVNRNGDGNGSQGKPKPGTIWTAPPQSSHPLSWAERQERSTRWAAACALMPQT